MEHSAERRAFIGRLERCLETNFIKYLVKDIGKEECELVVYNDGYVDVFIKGNTDNTEIGILVKVGMSDNIWRRVNVRKYTIQQEESIREIVREIVEDEL